MPRTKKTTTNKTKSEGVKRCLNEEFKKIPLKPKNNKRNKNQLLIRLLRTMNTLVSCTICKNMVKKSDMICYSNLYSPREPLFGEESLAWENEQSTMFCCQKCKFQ